MKQRPYWVIAPINDHIWSDLLRRFPPLFGNVYARQITWVYGCTPEFTEWPKEEMTATVVGRHIGAGHEALVVTVGSHKTSPSSKPLHITLSTCDGVPPAQGGMIDFNKITPTEPFSFPVQLQLQGVRATPPQKLQELQAA